MEDATGAQQLRDALRQVRALKQRVARAEAQVAVVGIGLRLPPDVQDPSALWQRLVAGEPSWGPPPAGRAADTGVGDAASWLTDVDAFDAARFGIGADEARLVDPSIRLLLEAGATALHHAELGPQTRTGVFIGLAASDWSLRTLHGAYAGHPRAGLGAFRAMASSRLAYALDLRGPALTVDASCASGLVAVDAAVRALREGACDAALAGAANLILAPGLHVHFRGAGLLARPDHVAPLTQQGEGYVRGEGVIVLALCRLDDALAAGRPILGVIAGSATGSAGRTLGLGTPSARMHTDVAQAALADARVDPSVIDVLELHGVGSPLADGLELQGLAAAYGRRADGPRAVGTVKGVLGHLEATSGLAGLVAALLMVDRGRTVPMALAGEPVEALSDPASGLVARDGGSLLPGSGVGVHAYGMSGHVAHVIVVPRPAGAVSAPFASLAFTRTSHWLPPRATLPVGVPLVSGDDLQARVLALLAEVVDDDRPRSADQPLAWQGVDSLALAALVARLQSDLGADPAWFGDALPQDVAGIVAVLRAHGAADAPTQGPGAWVGGVVAALALGVVAALWWLGFV